MARSQESGADEPDEGKNESVNFTQLISYQKGNKSPHSGTRSSNSPNDRRKTSEFIQANRQMIEKLPTDEFKRINHIKNTMLKDLEKKEQGELQNQPNKIISSRDLWDENKKKERQMSAFSF